MERDRLKRYIDDGLSLEEIGASVHRHPSTIGYWVKRHGLIASGRKKYAPRGGLTRDRLESLVEAGATLKEMALTVDRSVATVRYWLKKYGLARAARPGPRPLVSRGEVKKALRAGLRTVSGDCPDHGRTVFVIENSGRARCRQCRMDRVVEWRRRTKRRLVEQAGGRCRLCGYRRCMAALEFHHLDPTQKSFALSVRGVTRSIDQLQLEAAKCVLLCANCHAEVEAGYAEI